MKSQDYVRTAKCLLAQLRAELESAGLTPSRRTHELLTRSCIVRRDVAAMLASLKVSLASTSASGSGENSADLSCTQTDKQRRLAWPHQLNNTDLWLQPPTELAGQAPHQRRPSHLNLAVLTPT